MRKSTQQISPIYKILIEAIDAYCARAKVERPRNDLARARLLGISSGIFNRIKHGAYRLSHQMARKIATTLCELEADWRTLESRLFQPLMTAPDGSVLPPEVAFVRKFGVQGSVLMVEIMDLWPFSYGFETPTSPMSLAFKDGMDAGMSVILFVPNRLRSPQGKHDQSMGDGYHDTTAKQVFTRLQHMNPERVALYHLVENPCPTPRSGIRLTGLLPQEAPETRWWIRNRPHQWHFVPTSLGPEEFLDFFLGNGAIRNGDTPPTQEELEYTWNRWRGSRELPEDRPCPIERWEE